MERGRVDMLEEQSASENVWKREYFRGYQKKNTGHATGQAPVLLRSVGPEDIIGKIFLGIGRGYGGTMYRSKKDLETFRRWT